MSEPTPVPDIHDGPLSDLGHESLRLSVVAALDDLETKATQMDGSLLLVRTAFDFAETMLSAVVPLQQAVTDLSAQVATLAGQVADLQAAVAALQAPASEGA